jgi:hypothetical protein
MGDQSRSRREEGDRALGEEGIILSGITDFRTMLNVPIVTTSEHTSVLDRKERKSFFKQFPWKSL